MKHQYDMVVIGGGSAGLTASGISASLGAKTAMIETSKLGGDCTWHGCVPSKALIKAAKTAQTMRTAGKYGLQDAAPQFNFTDVIKRVHTTREEIYKEADAPHHFERMGIDVVHGRASFVDRHTINLEGGERNGGTITSRYFLIATGSSPVVPPIEGLQDVPFLTNETIFELEKLPEHLIVVGAGPIGMEMAQSFRRFGSQVTVVDFMDSILIRDNKELTEILRETLSCEGINFVLNNGVKRVEGKNGTISVKIESKEGHTKSTISGDALLLSVGRKPTMNGLNLKAACVEANRSGIIVNDRGRTSVKNIYACGDVTGGYQFTHMSEHTAKVAVSNALLKLPMKIDMKHVPWCTYTDPELAHVGATENELRLKNISFETYKFPYSKIDRALTDLEAIGLIKVYAKKWNGKILGVDILGAHAGDMLGEWVLALKNKVSLRKMADTIHPYPTYSLGNRRAADQWYIRKQSINVVKWIQRIFGYRGQLPDLSDPARIV
jgi:pyruvate/2-oxoglutarate dehydrogenase complex dihydrolipoamide dehydrogenase (E3) component